MSKKRIVFLNRCYHLVSRVAHKVLFFDAEEKHGRRVPDPRRRAGRTQDRV